MIRTATAHWEGNLKDGKGTLSTQSGILENTNYSFKTRFEEGEKGTNPEELLAVAHAGCFTMAVSSMLNARGITATKLDTIATVTMQKLTITGIHLKITGSAHGMNSEDFNAITKDAELHCVISKALKIPITSEAHFEIL